MSDGKLTLELDLLDQRISTLTELGDLTADLVATACRLAERLPMLGTAPPAVHLAMRLREAAGSSGLAGEIEATVKEVRDYQHMLGEAKGKYQNHEEQSSKDLRTSGEPDDSRGSGNHGSGSANSGGNSRSGGDSGGTGSGAGNSGDATGNTGQNNTGSGSTGTGGTSGPGGSGTGGSGTGGPGGSGTGSGTGSGGPGGTGELDRAGQAS
ncbi:hypothetical protein [Amycolatopsis sp. 195334CR]|uniref:hypothetical protein n=1 Tax=Amycolatopsis sp. 195334CR TaxID=2814588 RepID=UPI0035AB6C19